MYGKQKMSQFVLGVRGYFWALYAPLFIALGLGLAPTPVTSATELPAVVATVHGEPISADELTAALEDNFVHHYEQRHEVLKVELDRLIAERLIKLEAGRLGLSVEQLLQQEVTAKIKAVTRREAMAFYQQNRVLIEQKFWQARPFLETYLTRQREQARQQAFVNELRQRYQVEISLPEPRVDEETAIVYSAIFFTNRGGNRPIEHCYQSAFRMPNWLCRGVFGCSHPRKLEDLQNIACIQRRFPQIPAGIDVCLEREEDWWNIFKHHVCGVFQHSLE